MNNFIEMVPSSATLIVVTIVMRSDKWLKVLADRDLKRRKQSSKTSPQETPSKNKILKSSHQLSQPRWYIWFEHFWLWICFGLFAWFIWDDSPPTTGKVSWLVLAGTQLVIIPVRRYLILASRQ